MDAPVRLHLAPLRIMVARREMRRGLDWIGLDLKGIVLMCVGRGGIEGEDGEEEHD